MTYVLFYKRDLRHFNERSLNDHLCIQFIDSFIGFVYEMFFFRLKWHLHSNKYYHWKHLSISLSSLAIREKKGPVHHTDSSKRTEKTKGEAIQININIPQLVFLELTVVL